MWLFSAFKKRNPVIFKDRWVGKFRGNLLEDVAKFFPHPHSARILSEPALNVQWKLFERILWDGSHSQWFYTEKAVCDHVHALCSEIYQPHHLTDGYPNHFEGRVDGLPLVCMGEDCIVIWAVDKVQIQ